MKKVCILACTLTLGCLSPITFADELQNFSHLMNVETWCNHHPTECQQKTANWCDMHPGECEPGSHGVWCQHHPKECEERHKKWCLNHPKKCETPIEHK